MEYRNAQYNENGTIDCEINHPEYGWIPCTVSPDDKETASIFDNAKSNAKQYTPPVKTQEEIEAEIKADFERIADSVLQAKAQEKGYDNIISACSYAADANPFQAESKQFIRWRGAVWAKCYELLNFHKEAGTVPTKDEFLAQLPEFEEFA